MSKTPKVLLLGDSIRMSYQPPVTSLLKGSADVVGPDENCQFSAYTLASLDRWLDQLGLPDIVHWNNGLHDVGHNPDRSPIQYPLDEYISNLKAIVNKIRNTKAKIIWATTTSVHPNRPFTTDSWAWRNEEIDQYNDAALDLMRDEGISVNDLHSVINSNVDKYLSEDMLHLSENGIKKCAEAVSEFIKKEWIIS